MFNVISMQLFAHKKGVGSTKNGRDSESKRLGVKRARRSVCSGRQHPVSVSAVPTSIRVKMSAAVPTTPCLPRSTVR